MKRFAFLPLLLCVAPPVSADEIIDTLESALKSYQEGDTKAAAEDLAYATKLLNSQKTAALAKFLPAAPAGWTREDEEADDSGAGMAMLGGGSTVTAEYSNGETGAEVSLIADSPLVGSFAAMLSGFAGAAGTKPFRVQRVEFTESDDGLRGIVNNRVLVTISGDAPLEARRALLESMDLDGLGKF